MTDDLNPAELRKLVGNELEEAADDLHIAADLLTEQSPQVSSSLIDASAHLVEAGFLLQTWRQGND